MGTTPEQVLQHWKDTSVQEMGAGKKGIPSFVQTKRRGKRLEDLLKEDLGQFMPDSGVTKVEAAALALLLDEGKNLPPVKVQKAEAKKPEPQASVLETAAYRVNATRRVAKRRLAATPDLASALVLHRHYDHDADGITAELVHQKRIILQKNEAGHDLPGAAERRAAYKRAGLTPAYVAAKIDPQVALLAPFTGAGGATPIHPRSLWVWTVVVAARHIYEAAELSLDSPARLKKYRAAQPRSQVGLAARKKKQKKKQAAEAAKTVAQPSAPATAAAPAPSAAPTSPPLELNGTVIPPTGIAPAQLNGAAH